MRLKKEQCLLYAVTDRSWLRGQTLAQQVEAALRGGVTMLQLREKNLDEEAFEREERVIQDLCRSFDVPFIINDNVELAKKLNADGVHVGQDDMAAADVRRRVGPDMLIGVSAHSVEEALLAVKNGADCLGSGAVFATSTKTNTSVLPRETLRAICDAVDVPVVAIGGITKSNMPELQGCGADGAALVSAIFSAKDIEAECRELRKIAEETFLG